MSNIRASLLLRNAIVFFAMVAIGGVALSAIDWIFTAFNVRGIERLLIVLAAAAMIGVLGNLLFGGSADLRAWLVFLSLLALAAAVVFLEEPRRTFYPLLTAIPLAAVAAGAARLVSANREGRKDGSS